MLTFLQNYFFTGVTGNTAYDILKNFWQQVFGKDLEEIYLDAFEQAVTNERPRLNRYGDLVELEREVLRRALRTDLAMNVNQTSLSDLSEAEFCQRLAETMHTRQVLIIGGHNLTIEDYQQLLRNLIRHATAILRQKVLENEAAFNQMLLTEVQGDRSQLSEVQSYLTDRFDLTLQKLDSIESQTRLVPEILDTVKGQSKFLEDFRAEIQAGHRYHVAGESEDSSKFQNIDETDIKIVRDLLTAFFRDTSYFSGSFGQDVLNELRTSGNFTDEQARQLQRYFVQTGELNLRASDPRKVFTPSQDIQDELPVYSPLSNHLRNLDETDIIIARDVLSAFFRDAKYFSGSFSKDILNELCTAGGFTIEQARQLQRYFVKTGELNLNTSKPRDVFTPREDIPKIPSVQSPAISEEELARISKADQRCADLATNIGETLELIRQYEEQRRLADDPKAKRRTEREIADLRKQLSEYEAEAHKLGCE